MYKIMKTTAVNVHEHICNTCIEYPISRNRNHKLPAGNNVILVL